MDRPISTGGLALVFGAEGKGVRPLVRRACDATISIPLAGSVESLNVSVAAALLLYEARRRARWLSPTLYLFDGYNLLHAGDYADQREADRHARRRFVAMRGARGVLVWDGVGVDAEMGPLSVRYAPHADAVLERLARRASRQRRVVCLVSSDFAVRGHVGPGGAEAIVADVPRATCSSRATASRTAPVSATSLDDETRERLERLRRGDG